MRHHSPKREDQTSLSRAHEDVNAALQSMRRAREESSRALVETETNLAKFFDKHNEHDAAST